MKKLVLLFAVLAWPLRPAEADNPILSTICSTVDCLNNFTAKEGYSFRLDQEATGGFTDLKQSWYISPAPGFNYLGNDFTHLPNFDVNAVFKIGKLLSDKIPLVNNIANYSPFTQGLFKYATIGETASYDLNQGQWYDMSWVGLTAKF